MSGYDPKLAPRFLGDTVDVAALENAQGILLRDQTALQQTLDVFAEDGWQHIRATLEAEIARIKDELAVKTFTSEQIANVQGQIRAFEYLLSLPLRAAQQFKMVSEKRQSIERRISGGDEEEEIVEHT
jgi:hypothetical protein